MRKQSSLITNDIKNTTHHSENKNNNKNEKPLTKTRSIYLSILRKTKKKKLLFFKKKLDLTLNPRLFS